MVVDAALQLHRDLGPGLPESAYEAILSKMLEKRGLSVERQKPVPIQYQGVSLDEGFRLGLLVDGQLIVELKSVENIHPVHPKQLLTYLRLMNLPLGLLINFGASLLKNGLQRVANKHINFAPSRAPTGGSAMKPGSVKIVDRVSAVEAIKRLKEEDLLFLNRLIVERLKLISQARATTLMTSFTRGDRVGFQSPDGRMLEGRVLRLNKKTISVATDDGHQWNVAPGLLRLVQSAGDVQWP